MMREREPLKTVAGTPDRPLVIGGIEIQCYVLENELRVLSQGDFLTAINGPGGPGVEPAGMPDADELPVFLSGGNLKPFISKELVSSATPVLFQLDTDSQPIVGYSALLLPEVCVAYLEARDAGALHPDPLAKNAETLIRGLATVGVIALVDEATDYRRVCEQNALEKILNRYLDDNARKWAKTFPDEFWRKLIKIKGLPSYMAMKRPDFVGMWVNDIVYKRLAPGILQELEELNPAETDPITGTRTRENKHHQYLTEDQGLPELREHLAKVMTLMDAAANKHDFRRLLNTALPKHGPIPVKPLEKPGAKSGRVQEHRSSRQPQGRHGRARVSGPLPDGPDIAPDD